MIGLLLGELKRLSILRRVVLVAGAVVIAFIANCARAFFLVWIAGTTSPVTRSLPLFLSAHGSLPSCSGEERQRSEVRGQRSEVNIPTSYFLLSTFYFPSAGWRL